jgi:hypothetical protein
MPAEDVRGAAENVSLISYVGIWQFLLIVLVIASVSISFVFDCDISAVLAQHHNRARYLWNGGMRAVGDLSRNIYTGKAKPKRREVSI